MLPAAARLRAFAATSITSCGLRSSSCSAPCGRDPKEAVAAMAASSTSACALLQEAIVSAPPSGAESMATAMLWNVPCHPLPHINFEHPQGMQMFETTAEGGWHV